MFSTIGDSVTENDESLLEQTPLVETPSPEQNPADPPMPKQRKPVMIAVIAVLVLLVGTFAVGKLFFNRDFTQLLMGKTKYAQNIELATAKSSADQIVAGMDKSVKLLQTYTKPKTLDSTVQLNVKMEDQFLKGMGLPEEQTSAVQQTIKYLNTLKMSAKTLINEKGTQSTVTITDPSALKLTVSSLSYVDGKTYVHIPELLEQYLLPGEDSLSQLNPSSLANMKYDSAKMKTSLDKLAEVYANALSTAQVKAENDQSITIDGVTVQGQKLTASLTEAQTAEMFKAIAKAAKEDEYLYSFVADNYSLFSSLSGSDKSAAKEALTKEKYGEMIDEIFPTNNLETDTSAFSAVSYVEQSGALLAHSYEYKDGSDALQLIYLITEQKYAVELLSNQESGFLFSNTKTGEETGKIQLNIKSESEPKNIGVNVDYSGAKLVPFLDSETLVGKYVLSLNDPDHEIQKQMKNENLPQEFDQIDQSSITIESAVDGSQVNSTILYSIPKLLSASITEKISGTVGDTTLPAQPQANQVIDLSQDVSGEATNELGIQTIQFLSETMKKDSELTAVLAGFGITKEQVEMMAAYYAQAN
ncbi:hypothetical protein [Faecalispora anaeroviscerum]|uniref:hypothetical protein n=1 Tax=Faecalispora anaeroviscerum TaxID=2991836 RepID=UPI0024B8EBEE|nr:hypothetical protein [Faecalispora anaeroviscerum]